MGATQPRTVTRRKAGAWHGLGFRRMSKPQMAQLVLVATASITAAVLLLWLILWLRGGPRIGLKGGWIAQRGPSSVVIGHQSDDLRAITARRATSPGVTDSSDREILAQLAAALRGSGGQPVVAYLSAAGVSAGTEAFLLPADASTVGRGAGANAEPEAATTVARIIDLMGESPSRYKLLILDAGQVGTDRNLGVFGNGFIARLEALVRARKPKGVAILTSCAPGQLAWGSEVDGRSAFAHFVALGLSGKAIGADPENTGRLTIRALHNYVRANVANWARTSRGGAEQTPELYTGEPGLNFSVRKITATPPVLPSEDDLKATEELLGRLAKGWATRDELEPGRPERHAPLLWQDYRESLLRAELLIRVGARAEARGILEGLTASERALRASGPPPIERPWSLAAAQLDLTARPDPTRQAEHQAAEGRIDEALRELIPDTEAAAPAADEPAAEPAPPVAKSKAVAARPKAKPRPGEALQALVDRADPGRPRYVEAQWLVWADAFDKQFGVGDRFKGSRGPLFAELLRLRRLAEEAAAPDERVARWVAPIVEAGDAIRRLAQDDLLADEDRLAAPKDPLDQARGLYARAVDAAGRGSRAADMLARLEADLPYYGQWKAWRAGRRDPTFDAEFAAILALAAELARELDAGPPAVEPSLEAGVDPFAEHSSRLSKLENLAARARVALDDVRTEFLATCERLVGTGSRESWREIHDALRVPTIPAETRMRMVALVRSKAVASSLVADLAAGAAPIPPVIAGSREEYLSQQAKKGGQALLDRPGRESAEPVEGGASPSRPDPDYYPVALRMARLEAGLMAIGGEAPAKLAELSRTIDAAQDARNGDPTDAFDRMSTLVRSIRAARLAPIERSRPTGLAEAAALDRAARTLPPADARAPALGADKPAATLGRFRRHDMLVWHARRLLEDFAPAHASALLKDAAEFAETEPWKAATASAEAMRRAHLTLKPSPAGEIHFDNWEERPLAFELGLVGPVPPGDATVVVDFDPTRPLSVARARSGRVATRITSVSVSPDVARGRVDYVLARTEVSPEAESIVLSPKAFYRGRTFPSDREIRVTLQPVAEPVRIEIRQNFDKLAREVPDQFKEHPGQGFMHPTFGLRYNLLITSEEKRRIWVRYGLEQEGQELKETILTQTLDLLPRAERLIAGDKSAPTSSGIVRPEQFVFPEKSAFDTAMHVVVTVLRDGPNGSILATRRYPFRVIPPSQYVSADPVYDPATRTLTVWVLHRRDDPVTGPIEIGAAVGSLSNVKTFQLKRGDHCYFNFAIPLSLPKIVWSVTVEGIPNAIRAELDTPAPPPPPVVAPPAQ